MAESQLAPAAVIVKHLESTAGTQTWLVSLPNGKRYTVKTYPAPSRVISFEIPHKADPRFGVRVVHLRPSTVDAIREAIKNHG